MNLYRDYLLPHATHRVCASARFDEYRRNIVPSATGIVLETGFGTGLNLPYYQEDQVEKLFALDPSASMLSMAAKSFKKYHFEVIPLIHSAEKIPLEDDVVDTIVSTFTMCTIRNLPAALTEMKRVLKPGGELLYCEHGLSPDPVYRRMQHLINPFWKVLAGGCNLNRSIEDLIREAGFSPESPKAGAGIDHYPENHYYLGRARID